jgi:hypothetical protein
MNDKQMRDKIEAVLSRMEVQALEERIAPVKCDKQPDHPDCQAVALYMAPEYGIDDPAPRYGVGY